MSQATLPSAPYHNSNLFSGYYLDERVADLDAWDCDEEATEAFEELQQRWELEGDLAPSYKEDELLDSWIDDVLDVLGFGTAAETTLPGGGGYNDRLLFESEEDRREGALRKRAGEPEAMYGTAAAVLEAKQWGADFSARFSEQRSYRDASHQIKYYLEHTPERLRWGVLTDGRKWRLYGTKDYATETYYEVDLPELLASGSVERFKYFYAFFRPEAFRQSAGTSFLDTVWSESETAAQELGEDLQDNVFTALRVLGDGFVETNDLDIDPEDDDALEELKEQSLVLLYRLMFVLYAESRGLIHPDDPDSVAEYEEHFSLDRLRFDIHDDVGSGGSLSDYSEHSTSMWSRLEDLFRLVDSGEGSLGIPPYNGGLFDDDQHGFLAENQVADRYIAEVLYRLGTTESDDGSFVLADYADLDTRHLGSIYEGLLEHEFRIAPEAYAAVDEDGGQVWKPATEVTDADAVETVERGELYVVNDDGERKATGAYYTPDYVVAHIVEETVGPLIGDIDAELREDGLEPSDREYFMRFWQSVRDLTVLDPAMGSGHFLTKATGYLTERVMEVVREQEIQSYDEQNLRREIAKECIYGVDVNGMAVELAKLSMWLETLATDQPLAFLDHRLKTGDSLVGSDVTRVLSDDVAEEGGQLTLTQAFARVRKDTLDHVMDLMRELLAIDNETLDDVKSMEGIYREIRDDPLYERLFELANVHTAEQFGVDVPDDAYEEMAAAIEAESEWAAIESEPWFAEAQSVAADEDFFHWELEFPEVFFDDDGEKRPDAGFDVVAGNPPYISIENLDDQSVEYVKRAYSEVVYGRTDIYLPFIYKSLHLTRDGGFSSMIVPDKWLVSDYGKSLRDRVLSDYTIEQVWDLREEPVFEGVSNSPVVYNIRCADPAQNEIAIAVGRESDPNYREYATEQSIFDKIYDKKIILSITDEMWRVCETVTTDSWRIADFCYVSYGAQPGNLSKFVFDSRTAAVDRLEQLASGDDPDERIKPFIKGRNIHPYTVRYDGELLLYLPDDLHRPAFPELFEVEKIAMSEVATELRAALDTERHYGNETVVFVARNTDLLRENPELARTRGVPERDATPDGVEDIDLNYAVALLNSTLLEFYFEATMAEFLHVYPDDIRRLPIRKVRTPSDGGGAGAEFEDAYARGDYQACAEAPVEDGGGDETEFAPARFHERLAFLARQRSDLSRSRDVLNLSLRDHIGAYSNGETLAEIGLTQPPEDAAGSVLQQTTEQKPNLRVGEATAERESINTVEIRLTARYKPDPKEKGRDAYTETEPLPALRITDLSETEADLIEAFVPAAVDEAGGFAGFRETATKTNSLVDRLRSLTLPEVSDVEDGLASYRETVGRAEELEREIGRTDELIDEIVYDLYGLTDEEIEIVEEAVGE
ncbi:Eco57I restriction-modification methylase domain-containing protein [Halosimplex sp. TS25]|uniref:Eco57I restriction-modification methylase domain-containing protein n=1 Tax=Halosimplex rarum TaxID=3396619 RepID=UPI0039E8559C